MTKEIKENESKRKKKKNLKEKEREISRAIKDIIQIYRHLKYEKIKNRKMNKSVAKIEKKMDSESGLREEKKDESKRDNVEKS